MPRRSSVKLGDLKNQFSADMASVDHLMCKSSVLQQKHMDGRYVDQASINQIGDLTHRIPGSLPVDYRNGLAEASPLGFFLITLDITVCGHCEDVDQPAAGPEHVQRLRQGGGPYCVAKLPTPPAAPCMSTFWPGIMPPFSAWKRD